MTNSERLLALRRELSDLRSKIFDVEEEIVKIALAIQKDKDDQEIERLRNE